MEVSIGGRGGGRGEGFNLACPICSKRKAKRFCPARTETICSICCGTEREVTIDCPSDCVHLVASRQYDMTRLEIDWAKVPFAESKFDRRFRGDARAVAVSTSITRSASLPPTIARWWMRTSWRRCKRWRRLTAPRRAGLFTRSLWTTRCNAHCTNSLKAAIADFREKEAQRVGMTTVRDSDVRDALIFLTQLCAVHDEWPAQRTRLSGFDPPAVPEGRIPESRIEYRAALGVQVSGVRCQVSGPGTVSRSRYDSVGFPSVESPDT